VAAGSGKRHGDGALDVGPPACMDGQRTGARTGSQPGADGLAAEPNSALLGLG